MKIQGKRWTLTEGEVITLKQLKTKIGNMRSFLSGTRVQGKGGSLEAAGAKAKKLKKMLDSKVAGLGK